MNRCAYCFIYAERNCSNCKNVFYCSQQHQKLHWKKIHKKECSPYKIVKNELIGRHLIATRDIAEREIILRETPIVIGPKIVSSPICLGCHKKINLQIVAYKCESCHWPMCNNKCPKASQHEAECKLLKKHKYKFDISIKSDQHTKDTYSFIVPLRCLLLKKNDEKKYEELMNLQSNLKEILASPISSIYLKKTVPFLKNMLNLQESDKTILTICGILHTNAFEIRCGSDINIRGVYPKTSMMSHDCLPNTKHVFHGEYHELMLISTVPIKKGEIITTTYTQSLWGTLERKTHLSVSKFVNCKCKRCSSRDELSTYIGSMYCTKCFRLFDAHNPKMVSVEPLDPLATWKCEKCDHSIISKLAIFGNKSIKEEIAKLSKTNPQEYEEFLTKYENVLHPTNTHILQVKYALVQMYGNVDKFALNEMSVEDLARKIELCRELLHVANILEPGSSRFRGILIYELQSTMVMKAKREFANHYITLEQAQATVSECLVLLQEASEILKTEPDFKGIIQEKIDVLTRELS